MKNEDTLVGRESKSYTHSRTSQIVSRIRNRVVVLRKTVSFIVSVQGS